MAIALDYRSSLLLEKTCQSSKRIADEWLSNSFSTPWDIWDDICVFRDKAAIITMDSLYLNIVKFIDILIRKMYIYVGVLKQVSRHKWTPSSLFMSLHKAQFTTNLRVRLIDTSKTVDLHRHRRISLDGVTGEFMSKLHQPSEMISLLSFKSQLLVLLM